jgi:hypothetical protein
MKVPQHVINPATRSAKPTIKPEQSLAFFGHSGAMNPPSLVDAFTEGGKHIVYLLSHPTALLKDTLIMAPAMSVYHVLQILSKKSWSFARQRWQNK